MHFAVHTALVQSIKKTKAYGYYNATIADGFAQFWDAKNATRPRGNHKKFRPLYKDDMHSWYDSSHWSGKATFMRNYMEGEVYKKPSSYTHENEVYGHSSNISQQTV